MGGNADDKMTAPSTGGLGLGSNDIRADDTAAKEDTAVTAAVVLLVEERVVENSGSLASDAEGGIDPRGDAMGPAGESTHQSG